MRIDDDQKEKQLAKGWSEIQRNPGDTVMTNGRHHERQIPSSSHLDGFNSFSLPNTSPLPCKYIDSNSLHQNSVKNANDGNVDSLTSGSLTTSQPYSYSDPIPEMAQSRRISEELSVSIDDRTLQSFIKSFSRLHGKSSSKRNGIELPHRSNRIRMGIRKKSGVDMITANEQELTAVSKNKKKRKSSTVAVSVDSESLMGRTPQQTPEARRQTEHHEKTPPKESQRHAKHRVDHEIGSSIDEPKHLSRQFDRTGMLRPLREFTNSSQVVEVIQINHVLGGSKDDIEIEQILDGKAYLESFPGNRLQITSPVVSD